MPATFLGMYSVWKQGFKFQLLCVFLIVNDYYCYGCRIYVGMLPGGDCLKHISDTKGLFSRSIQNACVLCKSDDVVKG